MNELRFFSGKKVFVTGHTGFKGSWLCRVLVSAGALVTGYSLPAPTTPNLFELADVERNMKSVIGDIRDYERLKAAFDGASPEIVLHLAAQPIVRDGFENPRYTYDTNVMGTVNILECVRTNNCVKSLLNVTTDKVYQNNEWEWGYRETEPMNGHDPYSNSKSCSELVTSTYKNCFLAKQGVAVSTARAGNVIGGGDFANDRIIPDCIRAVASKKQIIVRNPNSTRPYQHVLEPILAYLMIAEKQYECMDFAGNYNVGPDECDCVTTGELVDLFCEKWEGKAAWSHLTENGPHEANFLKLDCSKLKKVFSWKPRWHIDDAIEKTCEWTRVWLQQGEIVKVMDKQIKEYLRPLSLVDNVSDYNYNEKTGSVSE